MIWCTTCKKSWSVRKWACPCGVPWCDCSSHLDVLCPASRKKRSATARDQLPTKPMTDIEAGRKLVDIEGQLPPSRLCLGPKLAARFGHLLCAAKKPPPSPSDLSLPPGPSPINTNTNTMNIEIRTPISKACTNNHNTDDRHDDSH